MVVRANGLDAFPAQLRLESALLGNFEAVVGKAVKVPPADVLWITVKAPQLAVALESVPAGEFAGMVVPLLNGIDHIAVLRDRFGHDQVVPATFAGETERVAPGHIVHRSPFALLNVSSQGKAVMAGALGKLEQLGFSCRFLDDEATLLWNKLIFLGPFALTTSALGAEIGRVLSDAGWYGKLESCVREACAVALAEGAKVNPENVLPAFRKVPLEMRSSMQKDVEAGRFPELDAIAGPVLRGGAQYGIPVPVTRDLVAAIEQKVAQRREI
jgi:2-dehydropantoate 2-reductase